MSSCIGCGELFPLLGGEDQLQDGYCANCWNEWSGSSTVERGHLDCDEAKKAQEQFASDERERGIVHVHPDELRTYTRILPLCLLRTRLPHSIRELILFSGSSSPALNSPEYQPKPWDGAVTLRKKLTRSDADFKAAVKRWLVDPVQTEAIYGHISDWRVSGVTDMSGTFGYARSFNQDLSRWDVASVTNMRIMFNNANNFNQDLSSWDVSSVTDMSYMFNYATSFDQDLSRWDVSSVTDMECMFRRSACSVLPAWYHALLHFCIMQRIN